MKPHSQRVTIGGKRWRLTYRRLRRYGGRCDHPAAKGKTIKIDLKAKQDGPDLMRLLIHEALHAEGWHLDEEYVQRAACDLTRLLISQGFVLSED